MVDEDAALVLQDLAHPLSDTGHSAVEVLVHVPDALLGHRCGDREDEDPRVARPPDGRVKGGAGARDQHDRIGLRLDDAVQVRDLADSSSENSTILTSTLPSNGAASRSAWPLLDLGPPVVAEEVVAHHVYGGPCVALNALLPADAAVVGGSPPTQRRAPRQPRGRSQGGCASAYPPGGDDSYFYLPFHSHDFLALDGIVTANLFHRSGASQAKGYDRLAR